MISDKAYQQVAVCSPDVNLAPWLWPSLPRWQRQLLRGSTPTRCCSSSSSLKGEPHSQMPSVWSWLHVLHSSSRHLWTNVISSRPPHLTCHFLLSFRYRIVTTHILTTLLQDVRIIGSLIWSQAYFRDLIHTPPSHVCLAGPGPARLLCAMSPLQRVFRCDRRRDLGPGDRSSQSPNFKSRCQARGLLLCSLTDICFRQINKSFIYMLFSCVVIGMAQVILLDIIMKVL